jgi:hypothetical protein
MFWTVLREMQEDSGPYSSCTPEGHIEKPEHTWAYKIQLHSSRPWYPEGAKYEIKKRMVNLPHLAHRAFGSMWTQFEN